MPIYKYKSFEEAERGLWQIEPSEDYNKSLAEFFELAEKLSPVKFPPGIYKFRNIEEANEHKRRLLLEK